jgi:hypothetical protein
MISAALQWSVRAETKEPPMRPPLKLNAIDQEHLQELYNTSGIARDELPYTDAFETVWQGFQDRTFKNAEREQLFGALLKYTRSSSNAAGVLPESKLNEDQLKQLKALLTRHAKGGKILPYSDEFEAAQKEFQKLAQVELTPAEFWHSIIRAQGAKRRPPARKKVAVPETEDAGDEDGE